MLGEGKFKRSVPDPIGEELETFQTVRIQPERTHVEAGDEHEDSIVMIHRNIGKEIHEEVKRELECEISERVVNLEALRKIAGSGQLDGEFRALVWKLLLGYLPAEKDSWERELAANRSRYVELKKELLINPAVRILQGGG